MQESISKTFNHLKIHTQFSICEGAAKIDLLKEYCKSNKIQSIGISDTANLCGALEFSESISSVGTQPIIGTQINIKYKDYYGLIPLIAKNYIGYKNIIELSSKSYLENDSMHDPHCNFEDLIDFRDGVIILSGSINSLSGNLFNKGLFLAIAVSLCFLGLYYSYTKNKISESFFSFGVIGLIILDLGVLNNEFIDVKPKKNMDNMDDR